MKEQVLNHPGSLAVMAYGAWSDDPAIFEAGLASQLGLLDSISATDGKIAETCRDSWHPQSSVVSWVDSAELARNLGRPELYEAVFDGQDTPRLAIILEDYWRHDVGADAHFLPWSRLTHGDNARAPLPPPDHYGGWVGREFTAHGIADPAASARGADYKGDGISNALHYWTLTNPRAPAGEPVLSAVAAEDPGAFRVRFVERPEAGAYGRQFRFSSDLAGDPSTWRVVEPASNTIVEDRGEQVVREAVFPIEGPRGFLVISYPAMAE
jgi:hypothetical protein